MSILVPATLWHIGHFKVHLLPVIPLWTKVGIIQSVFFKYTEKNIYSQISRLYIVYYWLLLFLFYFSALSSQILVTNMTNALLILKAAKKVFLYLFGKKFLTKMMFWTYSKIMTRNMYLGKDEETGLKLHTSTKAKINVFD